jgi:hypothetical protein
MRCRSCLASGAILARSRAHTSILRTGLSIVPLLFSRLVTGPSAHGPAQRAGAQRLRALALFHSFGAGQSTAALPRYFRPRSSRQSQSHHQSRCRGSEPHAAGSSVDQRRLGSTKGVRAELERVEADAGDPLIEEAGCSSLDDRCCRKSLRRPDGPQHKNHARWIFESILRV